MIHTRLRIIGIKLFEAKIELPVAGDLQRRINSRQTASWIRINPESSRFGYSLALILKIWVHLLFSFRLIFINFHVIFGMCIFQPKIVSSLIVVSILLCYC